MHYPAVAGGQRRVRMPILVAMLGYFVSAGAIVAGLLIALSALISGPAQTNPLPSSAAPKPTEVAAAANPVASAVKLGMSATIAEQKVAPPGDREPETETGGIRRAAATETAQQYLYRPQRQERAGRLASRMTDFDSRYLGYVDDPHADRYRAR